MNSNTVAELCAATKSFDGATRALDGVDLELRQGETTALLGPNGAGKTTAIRLLLGLIPADSGTVRIFGGDPRRAENRVRTGAMLQVAKVPETLRVREHIDIFRSYYPRPSSRADVLESARIGKLADRMFGTLSGGERQRVMLALAMCGNPELLFLDEPTVGLDVGSRRSLWDRIRALHADGRTLLLTTHYIEEAAALADRIVLIDEGRIVADGTPAELEERAGAASLEDAYLALTGAAEMESSV